MRRMILAMVLAVMAAGTSAGCALTARQSAIRYGYAVAVSAEVAKSTVKVLHDHDLISDATLAEAKAAYQAGRAVGVAYAALMEVWPDHGEPWNTAEVERVQRALDGVLAEVERIVKRALEEAGDGEVPGDADRDPAGGAGDDGAGDGDRADPGRAPGGG